MQCDVYNRQDYGGFWRRYFADMIDGILLAIAFAIVSVAPGRAGWILEILIFLGYMIGFKVRTGATPGYHLLGMKIVAINGTHVTAKQIVVRLISSFFSALPFGLGFLWIAFDKNKQAWHDKIAGTFVVKSHARPIQTVEIADASLIRSKLFAVQVAASCVVVAGVIYGVLGPTGVQMIWELYPLYWKVTTKYNADANVQIHLGGVLSVDLINSSFNELEEEEQAARAREVARFVRDEYDFPISLISVTFVAHKRSGLFTSTNIVASFFFTPEELGDIGDSGAEMRGLRRDAEVCLCHVFATSPGRIGHSQARSSTRHTTTSRSGA